MGMTRDEILAMKPGQELTMLIAEEVMGWYATEGGFWSHPDIEHRVSWIAFQYSTDMGHAWKVFEAIRLLENVFTVNIQQGGYHKGTRVWVDWKQGSEGPRPSLCVDVETAPEAICKAALLAILQ
jgi:hypothetical protein